MTTKTTAATMMVAICRGICAHKYTDGSQQTVHTPAHPHTNTHDLHHQQVQTALIITTDCNTERENLFHFGFESSERTREDIVV